MIGGGSDAANRNASGAAEHRQATPQSNYLAPRPPFWRVGPRPVTFLEIEKERHYCADVAPVAWIIGLKKEPATRDENPMRQHQEFRRDQPAMDLGGIVVRLRMIAVQFSDAGRLDITLQKLSRVLDGEAEIPQAALIAAPGGVANHHGQHVDADVIVIGSPDSAADQEPAVAATKIQNQRGTAPKDRWPVQRADVRQLLQCGLRPLLSRKDFAGDGDAELAFNV